MVGGMNASRCLVPAFATPARASSQPFRVVLRYDVCTYDNESTFKHVVYLSYLNLPRTSAVLEDRRGRWAGQ